MNTWTSSITTTSSSTAYVLPTTYQFNNGTWVSPPGCEPPEPDPASPLEWLDRDIEKTCALARAA